MYRLPPAPMGLVWDVGLTITRSAGGINCKKVPHRGSATVEVCHGVILALVTQTPASGGDGSQPDSHAD